MSVDCVWNVMVQLQKPDFFFRRNGRVHLNRRGRQFSQLLAAEVCASVVVLLDTPCFEVAWRVLATHSFRQFPLHFPFRASRCAITFQLDSSNVSEKPTASEFGQKFFILYLSFKRNQRVARQHRYQKIWRTKPKFLNVKQIAFCLFMFIYVKTLSATTSYVVNW
jgi:hypothetical protein